MKVTKESTIQTLDENKTKIFENFRAKVVDFDKKYYQNDLATLCFIIDFDLVNIIDWSEFLVDVRPDEFEIFEVEYNDNVLHGIRMWWD